MDRGKVGAAELYLPPTPLSPSSEFLLARLGAYWQVLGVTDPDQIAALSEQALRRAAESPEPSGPDPVARALVAAGELLDDWLARALELPRPSQELAAARAALVSGATPDRPADRSPIGSRQKPRRPVCRCRWPRTTVFGRRLS